MGDLGGLEEVRDWEEPRECFAMRRGQADPTSKNSSAIPGQHQHEKICLWTVFAVIFDCFGMRSDAAADHEKYREESTTGNLNALLPENQHAQHKHLTNLSESPSREEYCTTGKLIAGSAGHEHEQEEHFTNMSDLPKKCIKAIFSFTTPRDVCRLAAVSTRFRSAANSNYVWSKFIPPQCYQILPATAVPLNPFRSKRELYFHLCDPILIDERRKEFWLERSTGKIGYMISAKEIYIYHMDETQRYWRWVSRDDSSFDEVAMLVQVCWLDFLGAMDCRLLSSDTDYRVVFMLKFREDSIGWRGQSVSISVNTPEGEEISSEQLLVQNKGVTNDGWTEVIAAEFTVSAAEYIQDDEKFSVSFRMRDTTDWWKTGLLLNGVKIEPCKSSQ